MNINIYKLIREDSEGSNPELLKFLVSYGSKVCYGRGEEIVSEGDTSDAVYVFLEGEADVVKVDSLGHNSTVGSLSKGTVFGEMGVFLEMKRSASVVATSGVTLLKFDNKRFFDAIFTMPDLAYKIMKIITERVNQQNETIAKQCTLLEYYKIALIIYDAMLDLENKFDSVVLEVLNMSELSGISVETIMTVFAHLKQEEIIYDFKIEKTSVVHFSTNIVLLESFLFSGLPGYI